MQVKYGVVSMDVLEQDLLTWNAGMYFGGRMQKPVMTLRDDARIRLANKHNLTNALRIALFMLPPTFTEEELFTALCGLSYRGDPRMRLVWNK